MSPADLNNPFGPSCCEAGGECGPQSAQPCGCDPGEDYIAPSCHKHQGGVWFKGILLEFNQFNQDGSRRIE